MQIYNAIKARPQLTDIDDDDVIEIVTNIQHEVQRGEEADEIELTRWLRNLASKAEDIFEVAVATLMNPQTPFAAVARNVGTKVKQEREQG